MPELAGQRLFGYETDQGVTSITSTDVNGYLARAMSGPDFRTWGASTGVAERLAAEPDTDGGEAHLLRAIDATAEKLGNTREVCRTSYLHPIVPQAFREGSLERAWAQSRRGRWVGRAESTVNRLIASSNA